MRISLGVITCAIVGLLLCVGLTGAQAHDRAVGDLTIYTDALTTGWDDWSWGTTLDYSHADPVHSGSHSIGVQFDDAWVGLSLHAPAPIATSGYDALSFWVRGGATAANFQVYVQATDGGNGTSAFAVVADPSVWTAVTIPLSAFDDPAQIARITWQDNTGSAQPMFYLDDIQLHVVTNPTPTPTPDPADAVHATIDVSAARKPISPEIYGMNDADESLAAELALPVDRWGGNATSRYNWHYDISNHANDWYFENIKETNATDLPDDSLVNRFVAKDRRTGTQTLLTLPMTGFVANNNDLACGFSIATFGPQNDYDWQWRPDCGDGIYPNGAAITGNNPLDTSIVITEAFVADWVSYLKQRYGPATAGGVRFYALDNEPDIWYSTHRDVAPTGWRYQEFRDLTERYAAAVKAVDPDVQIVGPVVNGWTYYFYGAYDAQRQDWATPDDRVANGNLPFVPWYLGQLRAYDQTHGTRLLDYLDLHYYPQADGVALSEVGDANTRALRLRSTRSLWDPTYVDESWIADAGPDGGIVRLLPRMHEWIDAYYPGTKLAVTEYNFGGLEHINGALTQADVLGIFGREGLDLAALWAPPSATDPGAFAFRMYRNYDGQGSKFGDVSLAAASSAPNRLSIFAAQRTTDAALTIMLINKSDRPIPVNLTFTGAQLAPAAAAYRYSARNTASIQPIDDLPVTGEQLAFVSDPASIELLVIATNAANATPTPTNPPTATATATPTDDPRATPTQTNTPTATMTPAGTAPALPERLWLPNVQH